MKKILLVMMSVVMICTSVYVPVLADGDVSLLVEDAPVLIDEAPAAAEDSSISVILDGKYIEFDVQPALINDRTMVPVRAIFEALGATVDWIDETQTVVSRMDETEVSMKIDERYLTRNGELIVLDVPAQLVGERTLVPVRAISEAYGCSVTWNEYTNTVVIVSDMNSVVIATVNDEAVTVGYFNYMLNQVESYVMQGLNANADYLKNNWSSSLGDTSFGQYVIDSTLEQCVYIKANAQAAKEKGLELTQADKNSIKENCDYLVSYYGEYYDTVIASMSTTPEAIEEFYTDSIYADKYYDYLVKEGELSEAEIKKYLDDNYIKAKHILFTTMDMQTGMPLSQEEVDAKKKLAEDTLEKIKKGEDFDTLMKELSEDPGSATVPEGYLFTKGEMVEEFEKAAYALKVDKVSGLVETDFGYHIIKRVANGEYTEEDISMVKTSLIENNVSATMNTNKSNAKITADSNMISNVVPVGLE